MEIGKDGVGKGPHLGNTYSNTVQFGGPLYNGLPDFLKSVPRQTVTDLNPSASLFGCARV